MPTVDEDLGQLDKDIRQLKIEYEMYFGGGRKRPPADIQWRAEQLIKRYSERGADMNFSQRFRFNNLAQTYAKYQEVWRKRMKQKEEGFVQRHFGAAAKAIEALRGKGRKEVAAEIPLEAEVEAPPKAGSKREAKRAPAPAALYETSCSDPDHEPDKVQQLYKALVEAKKKAGEKTDALTFDNFQEFVRLKTQQLRKQKGVEQVDYAITVEQGQVKLKARTK